MIITLIATGIVGAFTLAMHLRATRAAYTRGHQDGHSEALARGSYAQGWADGADNARRRVEAEYQRSAAKQGYGYAEGGEGSGRIAISG